MLKYPKVGTKNPTVQLRVRNLDENLSKPVSPPVEVLEFDEHIYTAVTWITENELSVIWVNRVQNESSVSSCTEKTDKWECVSVTTPQQVQGFLKKFFFSFNNSKGTKIGILKCFIFRLVGCISASFIQV